MDGTAKEAIHFYENVLEAQVLQVQTYGEMPMPCPVKDGGKVIAPLERVPFSPAFGTVTDKFGVTFILVAYQSE
jgi:uncharacterized glyoxalase superfamily protein PhnB